MQQDPDTPQPKRPKRDGQTDSHALSPIIRTPPATRADPSVVSDRLTALAHDLTSLLDASMRQVSLLLRSTDDLTHQRRDDEESLRRLHSVRAALEQMVHLVTAAARGHSLLSTSAMGSRFQDQPAMSLGEAIRSAVSIMEPTSAEAGVVIHCAVDPALDAADARGLYTVIVNAIRNALESIRHRPGKGTIQILALASSDPVKGGSPSVSIRITDDGVGPPEQDLRGRKPDVFRPGFSTKRGSLGLGLAISRDLVLGLGGTMRLEPRSIGHGAELCIDLPAAAPRTGHTHREDPSNEHGEAA